MNVDERKDLVKRLLADALEYGDLLSENNRLIFLDFVIRMISENERENLVLGTGSEYSLYEKVLGENAFAPTIDIEKEVEFEISRRGELTPTGRKILEYLDEYIGEAQHYGLGTIELLNGATDFALTTLLSEKRRHWTRDELQEVYDETIDLIQKCGYDIVNGKVVKDESI